MDTANTLFDKIWQRHVIRKLGGATALLHIDRHLLHDLSGPPALAELSRRGLRAANPELCFAVPDHAVSSAPGRDGYGTYPGETLYRLLRSLAGEYGIRLFDLGRAGQGIVHVMAPELGLILPGTTVICGDSHTCTNGALGALAFGVGQSESAHALATQALRLSKPRQMRIWLQGACAPGVTAKDIILHIIARLGAAAASGCAVEFAGPGITAMPMEQRLTLCNLSVELGARFGLIAPDATAFDYLRGRPFAPQGAAFDAALADWRTLHTDAAAKFDREEMFDIGGIGPTVTWGTSPEQAMAIDAAIPVPAAEPDPVRRAAAAAALAYMDLQPGARLAGTPIDWVFIGSCANARLADLRDAAAVIRGRRVAPGVTAWVVPGSEQVKRDAERDGLDRIFHDAGFVWREPGCSLCVAANGEVVPPGARIVSTSNRNFVGRQGPGARTHLASPAVAAASAIAGHICDARSLAPVGLAPVVN